MRRFSLICRNQCDVVLTHSVCMGERCNLSAIRPNVLLRTIGGGAAFLGSKPNPPLFPLPHGRAARPVMPWAAGIVFSWSFYPSAHGSRRSDHAVNGRVVRCRLLAQTVAVSLVGHRCELCRLVVAVDVVVLSAHHRALGLGSQ